MNGGTVSTKAEPNWRIYEAPGVAAHYAALDYISPAERLLFQSYIKPGSTILDLGVGGGRTSRFLAARASRYVGVDYSASMVHACQSRFPELEFLVADASDLSQFRDASFDAVVFAFNGIDYIVTAEARKACAKHIYRILKRGGVFIFSSHNPRAILVRPGWNRERLRRLSEQLSAGNSWLNEFIFAGITCARAALALARAVALTFRRSVRRLPSAAFRRGAGYMLDAVHGGLVTCYRVPERAVDEMVPHHFRIECVLGDDYPDASYLYSTDWYYYVFAKPEIG